MTSKSSCFRPERLDLFWRFIFERQSIWTRRIAQGKPPPWTNDPVLQTERFTNVYRELDPGTKYVIEYVLELAAPRPDKLFNVMLYRLMGRSTSHAALGFQFLETFDPAIMERDLKNLRKIGHRPFTSAYMVSAYSSMGSSDKIENVSRLFGLLHADFTTFFERLEQCSTPAQFHDGLTSKFGFGNFLAYQVLVDLLYPLGVYGGRGFLPFSQDEWASAGPGAQEGIRMLLRPTVRLKSLEVMRWLHEYQRSEFDRVELDFPYLVTPEGRQLPISLANIQNCLCEFHKYVKIKEGTGRGRRKFSASSRQSSSKQMPIALIAEIGDLK